MKRAISFALLGAAFLSACSPGQFFGPALTTIPTSTGTSTPTAASGMPRSTPTSTPTPAPTPRPVIGPMTIGGIEILLTSAKMEYSTCYIRFLAIALGSGGKCLSISGNVTQGFLEKAAAIDFSQWTVRMDDQYQGVYTGSGPEALSWVFILPAGETQFIVIFPGKVHADLTPIID